MIIGFTGSRKGMSDSQCKAFAELLFTKGVTELHHGCCIGADAQAHALARRLKIKIIGYPPLNSKFINETCLSDCDEVKEPQEYMQRNRNIVTSTELLVVGPDKPEYLRSGTWSTKRFAAIIKKPFYVLPLEDNILGLMGGLFGV